MNDTEIPLTFEAPSSEELNPLFPGYEIQYLIATGGMGAVYRAVQNSLDRTVAIKILPRELSSNVDFRTGFQTEAKAMAKLNHSNLIGVYDFGEVEGMLFIIMEFVEGKSLFHSAHGKCVHEDEVIRIISAICNGLEHAHSNGILHRDIKPANILLTKDIEPKIGDFGLARPVSRKSAEGELIYGTPGYTAPEVTDAPETVDHRSDLFAVGVMLHELLCGMLPSADSRSASEISDCNPRFDKIISRATDPAPEKRYASAAEIAKDLKAIAAPVTSNAQTKVSGIPMSAGAAGLTPHASAAKLARQAGDDLSSRQHQPKNPAWGLIRNVFIITILIAACFFTYEALQTKKAKEQKAKEEFAIKQNESKQAQGGDAIATQANDVLNALQRSVEKLPDEKAPAIDIAITPKQPERAPTNETPRAIIQRKLDSIIIPSVHFEGASLSESVDFLRMRARELDLAEPELKRKGVNLVITQASSAKTGPINLKLVNVTISELLEALAEKAEMKVKVNNYFVELLPLNSPTIPDVTASQGEAALSAEMIIIPSVQLENATIAEAVDFYNARAKELARETAAPLIILDDKADMAARIPEFRVVNVSLLAAVSYIARTTGHQIQVESDALRITKAQAASAKTTEQQEDTEPKTPAERLLAAQKKVYADFPELHDKKGDLARELQNVKRRMPPTFFKQDNWPYEIAKLAKKNLSKLNAEKKALYAKKFPRDAKRCNGKRYSVIDDPTRWSTAKFRCEKLGGRIASIHDETTELLLERLALGKECWIGGSDKKKEDEWLWSDGSEMTYRSFSSGQPNNLEGDENYLILTGTGWYDKKGDQKYGYVCEWDDRFMDAQKNPHEPNQDNRAHRMIDTKLDGLSMKDQEMLGWVISKDYHTAFDELHFRACKGGLVFANGNDVTQVIYLNDENPRKQPSGKILEDYQNNKRANTLGYPLEGEFSVLGGSYKMHVFDKGVIILRSSDGSVEMVECFEKFN